MPAKEAEGFARRLIAQPEVWPIGLGARDSLRLETGLCLYGHDIDESTTPVEADLALLRGAESLSLPDTGHFAALEQPDRVAEILVGRSPSPGD